MASKDLKVIIKDDKGNIVVDEIVESLENGFMDFWLARDKTYTVAIEYEGKTVESEISTFIDSPTCITTMQLI